MPIRPAACVWLVVVCAARATAASPPSPAPVRIDATIGPARPQLRGVVTTPITNRSAHGLDAVVLVLFPNRFAAPDAAVTDVDRPFVYPYEDFDPGGMAVHDVLVDGRPAATSRATAPGVPDGCLLRVALPRPVPPGATASLQVAFETTVPTRFGTFGTFEGTLTALGGWYPFVAPSRADGTPALDGLPARTDFDVALTVDPQLEIVLNGRHVPHPTTPVRATIAGVHSVSLFAAPTLLREDVDAGATHVVLLRRPPVRTDRRAFGPSQDEITRDALRAVVAGRPAMVPGRDELVVVEAPLRLDLTAPGEGMVVLSDRSLKVFPVLRPFHEAQIAQGAYAELLRPGLAARESPEDYAWVSEGLSYEAARLWRRSTQAHVRSVQDWIELFNVFAIVDRFETAPKIPFVGAFFERARQADPLHQQLATFNNDLPPGHVILGKLHHELGDATFARVVDACTAGAAPFRACAATTAGTDLRPFFAQWLQPYPDVDYALDDVHLNARDGDAYRSTATIRRTASRDVHEPVALELRTVGGAPVRMRWDGTGDHATLSARTDERVRQAVVDPDRTLIETTRANDARPPSRQIVLDTAEVEISSTEFGLSGLLVGRNRYDYRKDIAAAGFYTNRSLGVDVGPRLHWGQPNDPTLYRHNLYAFWNVQRLDPGFEDDRRPGVHTPGHLSGVGARYDYNNLVAFDNPSREVDVRLFGDAYDGALGSDFDYADWGGSLTLTHPLWSNRSILAGQVTNGFSRAFDGSRVPLQGLFSLGGERAIRGIGAQDELARNVFLVRTELRQMVYPELDLNLLDLLVLRRSQIRPFVDVGRVSNSAGAIYDPSRFAVGAGVGFAAVYDFMGFFPSLAYLEIATRVDRRQGDVQVLFGTRQSF